MRRRYVASLSPLLVIMTMAASVAPASAQTFGTPAPANPFTPPAPAYSPSPYAAPNLAPTWDPYAAGTVGTPQPALPPYGTTPTQPNLSFPYQDWSLPQTKLIQNVAMRATWLYGDGGGGFGMTDVNLSTALAFPFFHNHNLAPLMLTPGFNFHLLNGPDLDPPRDLPGAVYDTFLQLSWQPQFTERLGADLAVSVGVYSDFNYVDSTSIRILGRGVGTFAFNPQWKGVLGAVYLDRLDVKVLPVFGFIWTPHSDARFELLFPQPKLSQRITNWGNSEIWGYIGGEYGGGQWSVEHGNGLHDEVNYNDFRLYVGVESKGLNNRHIYFEVGYVFNREIIYRFGGPQFEPDDTVMLRAGMSF